MSVRDHVRTTIERCGNTGDEPPFRRCASCHRVYRSPTTRIRAERTSVHDATKGPARRLDGRGVGVVGGVKVVVGCWPSAARTPSP